MKASELITILKKELDENRDTEVLIWEDDISQLRKINGVILPTGNENAIIINA